jgi:gliding motility-associated-like protein
LNLNSGVLLLTDYMSMGNSLGKKIGSLLVLIILALSANAQCIVINEVMANAAGGCDGGCMPSTAEWVELYNTCNTPQDISCFVLTDGDFGVTFPAGTIIQPYSYFVVGSANSGVSLNLDLGLCGCTSGPTSQVGIFTNTSEQLVFTNESGVIQDGLYWGGGQFAQTPSFTTVNTVGCPDVTINLSASDPALASVSGQSNNDGESIYRECDGTDVWLTGATVPTPGTSNAPFIPITSTPTIVQPSCGTIASIDVFVSGGVGPFIYEWLGTTNTTPSIGNLQPGNYTVAVTDQGQCETPQLFTYTIVASPTDPVLVLTPTSSSICVGESTTIVASGSSNYVWNADLSLNTTIGSTVIATPTITTTYFGNSSINGCSQTASVTIVVSEYPSSAVNSNSPLCEGSVLNLTAAPVAGANYLWSGPNVFSSLNQNPTINAATPLSSGTYICNVALGNCVSTYSTDVIVDAAIPSTIDPAGPFCISDALVDLNSPNEPGIWSGNGITNVNTGAFLPSAAGALSSAITFDSDAYCTSPSTINVQVTSALNATITPVNALCVNGSPVQLQTLTAGGTWSGNAVNSSGSVNPTALGVGSFQAIYTFAGSCGDTDEITVQVVPLPQFNFSSSVTTGCAPLNVQFNSSSASALTNCIWTIDGLNVGSGCGSFNYNFLTAGCFTVGLQSTDGNGCANTISITDLVCVDLFPEASFQWSPITPSINSPIVDFVNTSLGNTTSEWNINGESSFNADAQYTFSETIGSSFEACLEVSNQYGCADSTCYTIFVNREEMVFVPNSFSPNDDGLNDVFFPVLSGFNLNEIQYSFSIYNRYGERIFYSEDPNQAWIGNVYGNEFYAQIDAYTWSLQITTSSFTEPIELTGSVVVIR